MKNRASAGAWIGFGATALVVILADQWTKGAIRQQLPIGGHAFGWPAGQHPLVSVTHEVNSGVAFGLFKGNNGVLLGLATAIAVGLAIAQSQLGPGQTGLRLAMGLQVGGAFGNVLDRLRFGHVTDFLHLWIWPVFNVADTAVSLGTVILLWHLLREPKGPVPAVESTAVPPLREPLDGPTPSPDHVDAALLDG